MSRVRAVARHAGWKPRAPAAAVAMDEPCIARALPQNKIAALHATSRFCKSNVVSATLCYSVMAVQGLSTTLQRILLAGKIVSVLIPTLKMLTLAKVIIRTKKRWHLYNLNSLSMNSTAPIATLTHSMLMHLLVQMAARDRT